MSLSLPDHQITYVFVLSLLAPTNGKISVIVHLVRMTTVWTVIGFCLIGVGESYTDVQERIEKIITSQMDCVEGNGSLYFLKKIPGG